MNHKDLDRVGRESMRLAAERELKRGVKAGTIARHYRVSRTTAYRWRDAVRAGASMKRTRGTGRPRLVTMEQMRKIFIAGAPWHCIKDFAAAIEKATGVIYNGDHVCRLLGRLERATGTERGAYEKPQL